MKDFPCFRRNCLFSTNSYSTISFQTWTYSLLLGAKFLGFVQFCRLCVESSFPIASQDCRDTKVYVRRCSGNSLNLKKCNIQFLGLRSHSFAEYYSVGDASFGSYRIMSLDCFIFHKKAREIFACNNFEFIRVLFIFMACTRKSADFGFCTLYGSDLQGLWNFFSLIISRKFRN